MPGIGVWGLHPGKEEAHAAAAANLVAACLLIPILRPDLTPLGRRFCG